MEREARSKKEKRFSLEGLKEAREGGVSRLDQLQLDEDDDVYELVEESKYAELVENRRKGGDFVVDDNGLGYYDDGEEILGVGEDDYDAKKRLKEASREGDDSLSKKARRLAESSSLSKSSILRHLQPANGLGAPFNTGALSSMKTTRKGSELQQIDLDSLLGSAPLRKGGLVPSTTNGRSQLSSMRMASYQNTTRIVGRSTQPIGSRGLIGASIPGNRMDDASDFQYHHEEPAEHHQDYDHLMEQEVDDESHVMTTNRCDDSSTTHHRVSRDTTIKDEHQHPQEKDECPLPADNQPKLSLSKTNRKFKPSAPTAPSTIVSNAWGYKPDLTADSNQNSSVQELASLSSKQGAADTTVFSGKIDPKNWLLRREAESSLQSEEGGAIEAEEYVNMYWLDASESNGLLYIFGKVPTTDDAGVKRFVSCCVVVHGSERNLFVLPRCTVDTFKEDGTPERVNMGEVHKEISSMLVPGIIPRSAGQSFRCKAVKRRYAFEHGDIPRHETEYLKIVYSAKLDVPSPIQCKGGKSYERIFGAGSSALELFLLKRKLMGPCWITIRKPKLNPSVISWCRIEMAVENPKFITRCIQDDCGPSPTLTSLTISIKTAVNPNTHLHEVVLLSGVFHNKIDSEADSSLDSKHQKHFTIVRSLGMSCGNNYPGSFPHDLERVAKDKVMITSNERALLSLFFARLQQEDPDVICSHNLLGFECDVILARAIANKIANWSLLGRLRKSKPPKSINDKDVAAGRILCDTYKAAKELLRETTYSLTHLAQTQLKARRVEVDPVDVPKFFSSSQDIMNLSTENLRDAYLVQGLMLKLQVIPLTKQLTTLSGNLWSKTIRGARAERIEYLLLHEFYALKYILPEKKPFDNKKASHAAMVIDEDAAMEADNDEGGPVGKVGGTSRKRAKAAYAGGLVLEPKKGLYDTYILLLDFNSLYPSIIQEYNLCFTTVAWTKYMFDGTESKQVEDSSKKATSSSSSRNTSKKAVADNADEDSGNEDSVKGDEPDLSNTKSLPPYPDSSSHPGVLPRVIKNLVDRRRSVKDLLKKERDPAVRQQLDIRQKALKLTANSMYGCLGFSFSRFYARPIAAMVTAMGREALQRTVDLATNQLSLDVIYGDTDSVMINTNLTDLKSVKEIGLSVKKEVNKLYRSLELELDGIFKSMLLLKKKKYAAVVINEGADGKVTYEKEMKGLDLVRRDWCVLSKETGTFVVEQILSGNPREEIVQSIHDYLSSLAAKIRSGELGLDAFVITKGLNKNPKDYPDCKGQAHLQVALRMLKADIPVNIGDHIPYVICMQGPEGSSHAAQRAYHPDEVMRSSLPQQAHSTISDENLDPSNTTSTALQVTPPPSSSPPQQLTIDYEWYLSNQILPPISRLCEPIEGTSAAILSEKLGLDASKYARSSNNGNELLDEGWGFTPKCYMDDAERFQDCLDLSAICSACNQQCVLRGVQSMVESGVGKGLLNCDYCGSEYYGRKTAANCYCYLSNRITLLVRACLRRYYDCWLVCDDPSCTRRTMQQSVKGYACGENCHGRIAQEYDEAALHTQLKCLEALFDVKRYQNKKKMSDVELNRVLHREQLEIYRLLHEHMSNTVEGSAYNWIRPSLWATMFGKAPSTK